MTQKGHNGRATVGVRRGPELGAHAVEILGELGYDDVAIESMQRDGVI